MKSVNRKFKEIVNAIGRLLFVLYFPVALYVGYRIGETPSVLFSVSPSNSLYFVSVIGWAFSTAAAAFIVLMLLWFVVFWIDALLSWILFGYRFELNSRFERWWR